MPDGGILEMLTALLGPTLLAGGEAAAPAALAGAEAAAGAAAPAALAGGADLALAGLPAAAGAAEVGTGAIGGLPALGGAVAPAAGAEAVAGLGGGADAAIPANATLTSGGPLDFLTGGAGPAAGNPVAGVEAAFPASSTNPVASAGGGITDWFKSNATTLGIGGAGIGAALAAPALAKSLGLTPKLPNEGALTDNAKLAGAQAQNLIGQEHALTQPLITGELPPAQMQAVQNAENDAIASVKSKYAGMGLSGSTMELEAINNVKNQSASLKVNVESQLAATGLQMGNQALQALGLQDQVYTTLMNATIQQDKSLQDAIAKMAGAAALGSALKPTVKTV